MQGVCDGKAGLAFREERGIAWVWATGLKMRVIPLGDKAGWHSGLWTERCADGH